MRTCWVPLVLVCLLRANGHALVVPDEVPTLLSLIYSNIPTLRKGTDSRLGWGFRFGNRADFQVLLELGPQKETAPLANQGTASNKRHIAQPSEDLQISATGEGEVDARDVIPGDTIGNMLQVLYKAKSERTSD